MTISQDKALRYAFFMLEDSEFAKAAAADSSLAQDLAAHPLAVVSVLENQNTRATILGQESSAPLVYHALDQYTPIISGGTSSGDRQWSQERVLNNLIGRSFGGGFIVSARQDKDSNKFVLIDGGADGDSFQREADGDGNPGGNSNGQMDWNTDDTEVFSSYNSGEQTDGLFLTNEILAHIRNNNLTWANWPIFNFIKQIRAERLRGRNDWYIPGQASTDNFGTRQSCDQTGGLGQVTEGESEIADLCWYLLKGMDSRRDFQSDRCYPSHWIPAQLETFFQTDGGVEAFDDFPYWSSAESGSAAFNLNFNNTRQGTTTKSALTRCVRAARRVYL